MEGHTEHRGAEWNRKELYRSTMQALEGRCSTRSNFANEIELQIREFTATLQCRLIDELHKRLEELNEPDRLLISRLNRGSAPPEGIASATVLSVIAFGKPSRVSRRSCCVLSTTTSSQMLQLIDHDKLRCLIGLEALCESGDSQSSVLSRPYHMLSPTRPAHRVWTMCTKDPEKLKTLVSEVCKIASITDNIGIEQSSCDVKFSAVPPSAWSATHCVEYLLGMQNAAEDALSERRIRHFGSYRSMKNGCSLMKSASVASERSTSSLPTHMSPDTEKHLEIGDSLANLKPFSEISKEKSAPEDVASNGRLMCEGTKSQIPLEPSIFVREMRQTSFRESSLTDESDSACALKEEAFNSTSPSAASSNQAYTAENSFDSREQAPLLEQATSSLGPSVSSSAAAVDPGNSVQELNFTHFGGKFLSRPIDIIVLPDIFKRKQLIAVSDSCGGVYILTNNGELVQYLPTRDSSASSLAVDPTSWHLLVSLMHTRARSIAVYDIVKNFQIIETIPCPKDPKVELSRTRWITVSPRGELFAVSGDNHRSALWMYNRVRKGWKILKESKKTRYQYLRVAEDQAAYKAVVLLTCDAARNRILLFVVDNSGALVNEYDLSKAYRLYEYIRNPASAVVDSLGNLLVLDYATGRLWALVSSARGARRLKEIVLPTPLGAQEALGIVAHRGWIYVTCFARREVVCAKYLTNGLLSASNSTATAGSPQSDRRAVSLPRPSAKPNQL